MNTSPPFTAHSLAGNSDAFAKLLESASSYFEVFDGMDFWIPAEESPLSDVLVDYVRLDVTARTFAEEHFEWDDSELNEHWTFYPCGFLYGHCLGIEVDNPEFSEEEFVEKLQGFATSPAYDPWDNL